MLTVLVVTACDGIAPGDFLTGVLENDLMKACSNADSENLANIPAYAAYLYNHAPIGSYGSPELVKAYMARKAAERAEADNA